MDDHPNFSSTEQIIDLTNDAHDSPTVDNASFAVVKKELESVNCDNSYDPADNVSFAVVKKECLSGNSYNPVDDVSFAIVKNESDASHDPVKVITDNFIIMENPEFHSEKSYEVRVQENSEESEVLPPPLTLDDPSPSRRGRRKSKVKINENKRRESAVSQSHQSQRLQRNCKNKITNYTEDFLDIDTACFLSLDVLNQEQSQQIIKRDHVCDLCDASFEKASGLKRHKARKHFSKSKSVVPSVKIKIEDSFDSEKGPDIEIDQTSDILISNTIKKKEKKYFCPQCGKGFSFRGNMRRHLGTHLGNLPKHKCPQCGKLCSTKQAVIGHIRFIHTGERPFQCKVCLTSFATPSDLRRHMYKHSDIRLHKCSDCGKTFKQRASLIQHMQRKVREKTWHCTLCPKRFTSKHSLKSHMVIHSDIKRFECESCQRKFSHRNSLEAHMKVHAGLMPFMCPVCGKKFAHRSNRNRHVREMHE